ncbi:centromere protein P isoform X2 [Ornithorhynchus anatinus]|uniref:centromere protein P isoform X2 n=1 Tax=Ornithorhynchus anatinus TaxID=9258 RepID=UPI0019D421A8|nr:centromere protein P isoform X2 [Ornithorhynchus anatinus]
MDGVFRRHREAEEEVRALEAEIAALRRVCAEEPPPEEERPKAINLFQEIPNAQPEEWESVVDLKTQLKQCESDLSFLKKLTGIDLINYSQVTIKSEGKIIPRIRFKGNCSTLEFELEFQLLEAQSDKNQTSRIFDLSIIMESVENSELSPLVYRAEEKGDLFQFFRSLNVFAELYVQRETILKHFKEKYPDIVSLPEGASARYMTITNPRLPGFELVIVWVIQMTDDGVVWPKLDLLVKISEQAVGHLAETVE